MPEIRALKKAYLEITNVCNLRCSFCPGTKREKRFMSADEFSVLAEKIRPHTEFLYLHLMGEPLLHPELDRILAAAGELGFKVIITTNGVLLPSRTQLLVGSPAVYRVNISLQSFEANSDKSPDDYIRACTGFAREFSESGRQCIFRLWNKGGLDSLNGHIKDLLEESFPQPWTLSRGREILAERVRLDPGERFDWPDMSAEDRGESCFCYGLRDQIGVLCDGTVVPCCLDHDGDIPLGNLFEQELGEILASPAAQEIYNGFSQRRAKNELCRRCGYARRF